MTIQSNTYRIIDNREGLNDPIFKNAEFEMHYRYKEPNNGGIVIIGIQQGGKGDYIELEIPWDWLPTEIKNTRSLAV